ncbi:MAG: hypothetical protein ABIB79_05220 [archaeon]
MKTKRTIKGQEEMVGFAMIVIIVAVILLVFLAFSIKKPSEGIESYEIESFIQAFLQHTSDCRDQNNLEYRSIQDLISDCDNGKTCLDSRDTCEVLDSTLTNLIKESWKNKADIKGYELNISSEYTQIFYLFEGNKTYNYKIPSQEFRKSSTSFDILFTAYY